MWGGGGSECWVNGGRGSEGRHVEREDGSGGEMG